MIYSLTKNENCDLELNDIYNQSGYIVIPDGIPDANFINSIQVEYIDYCGTGETTVIDSLFIPLPKLVEFELTCDDISGTPNYTLSISSNTGPVIPVGTTYDWYIKRSNSVIFAMTDLLTSSITWQTTQYLADDIIEFHIKLPNDVIVKIVKTITTVTPGSPCYTYALGQSVVYVDYPEEYTYTNQNFVFKKPADKVYRYQLTINYNTDTENGLELIETECQVISCNTECDVAKYTAEHLCSDLYIFYRATNSAISCQRCEDACIIFQYLQEQLDNSEDCHCNEPPKDCC